MSAGSTRSMLMNFGAETLSIFELLNGWKAISPYVLGWPCSKVAYQAHFHLCSLL